MNLLADTNVISFIFKRDTRGLPYEQTLASQRVGISFASVAELYQWSIRRAWGPKRVQDLVQETRRYVVLPPDDATSWEWARIMSIKGKPITSEDAWIAASALRWDVPLVTHNKKHFEHIPNLTLISHAP